MKPQRTVTLLILLINIVAYSQNNNINESKYSIGIKTYSPIYLTGADKFYNDNWITDPQKRTYYKYAFGLDFNYHLTENISLIFWGGASQRTLNESSSGEGYNSYGQLETNSSKYEYKQTSYNACVDLNFSEKIKKFEINTGLGLAFLHTGKGQQTLHTLWMEYENPALPDSNATDSKVIISPGNSFGLDFYIGTAYNISKHFSIGTEFHAFMFYSVFTNTSIEETNNYKRNWGTTTTFESVITETKDNFRQLAFSTVLPVFNIRYKF